MMTILMLLLACGGDDAPTPDTSTTPDPAAFPQLAEEAGFAVGDGLFVISDYGGCCDPGAKCLGNNLATPYGTWAVPPVEGDTTPPPIDPFEPWSDVPEPLQKTFRMREDEALVWLGTAPPKARYFSVRSYLGVREDPDGDIRAPLASLGPSFNNLVLEETFGEPIWDQTMAVVTTANATVEAEVVELLAEIGVERVVRDRLPMQYLKLGLDDGDDGIQVVTRAAFYDDPAAGQAWLDDPGATVWRLTPKEERASDWHELPTMPVRGTGDDELALRPEVDALQELLQKRYPSMGVVVPGSPHFQETLTCIDTMETCAGDSTDRLAATSPSFFLDPADESVKFVVFGVNHEATGKSAYANISVTTRLQGVGAVTKTHDEMRGSAQWFGYDGPNADLLYAFVVSRDCSREGGAPCMEVAVGCPGAWADEAMHLTERAYLEEATKAAPLESELVMFRAARVP